MEDIIIDLPANDLESILKEGKIPVIDVRRVSEFEQIGIIEGSIKLTFFDEYNNYDFEWWLSEFEKIVDSKEKPFVLVCAHANRTRTIGEYLAIKLGYKEVYHLEGGIANWMSLGKEVKR